MERRAGIPEEDQPLSREGRAELDEVIRVLVEQCSDVIGDEKAAEKLGREPLARIVSRAAHGVEPHLFGIGPVEAANTAVERAGIGWGDIDIVELNEAFAAQVLPVCWELGVDPFGEKLNPHGGAIALGHPYGMTGARIMCTLLNDLETLDRTIGLETMCVGGGQGMAMLIERSN